MSMTDQPQVLMTEALQQRLTELAGFLQNALHVGTALHHIEQGLWKGLLQLGHDLMEQLFTLAGDGDRGATITLPTGEECRRLQELHQRRYVSIFGVFELRRVVYGSREGQALDFVPLDNRLQLPASDFSYVLQDWDQNLCVEEAFGQARSVVVKILGLKQAVDSLEHMNQQMAQDAPTFLLNRPLPDTAGEILVTSVDGKGIVMRRTADDPAPPAHRTKGDKASQKRMATVGTAYTVDRYVRTPEQVVAA